MKMVATAAAGTVTVFVSLLLAQGAIMQGKMPVGLPVLLSRACKNVGDGRPILIRYRLDHSSSINGTFEPLEGDLRRRISSTMASRWERVVYLAADDRLTYGEVSMLVSDLENDDPTLHVALMMKKQVDARGAFDRSDFTDLCF